MFQRAAGNQRCWWCGKWALIQRRCVVCVFTKPYRPRAALRQVYDTWFLRQEYQVYPDQSLHRCAPSDWVRELEAICRGEEYRRFGHSLRWFTYNLMMMVAVWMVNVGLIKRDKPST